MHSTNNIPPQLIERDFPTMPVKGNKKKALDLSCQESNTSLLTVWGTSISSPPSTITLKKKKSDQQIKPISSSESLQKVEDTALSTLPKLESQNLIARERKYPEISSIKKYNRDLSQDLLKGTLSSLKEASDFKSAHEIYKKSLQEGTAGPYVFHAATIVFAKIGERAYFFEILGHMKQAHVKIEISLFDQYIKACSKEGDLKNALLCFIELTTLKIEPTERTFDLLSLLFNQSMNALADRKNPKKALELYHQMEIYGIPPDVYTFGSLIKAYVNVLDMKNALMIYRLMDSKAVEPNTVIFNTLLNGAIETNKSDLMHFFLKEMLEKGVSGDERTENILLKQATHIEDAIQFLSKSPTSSSPSYQTAITLLIRQNKLDEAFKLFERVKKEGLHNNVTYHILMNGVIEKGLIKKAFELFDELSKSGSGLVPSVTTYNILIKGCGRIKDIDKAISLKEEMKKRGLKPDLHTYNSIIYVSGLSKNLDLALDLYEEMKLEGVSPDQITYNTLYDLGVKLNDTKKVLRIQKEMQERNMSIGEHGYTSLMTKYNTIQEFDKTIDIFKLMLKNQITPDLQSHTCLIKAYCGAHRMGDALNHFRVVKSSGIKPDELLLEALINGCIDEGLFDDAFSLLKDMHKGRMSLIKTNLYGLIIGLIKTKKIDEASTVFSICDGMDTKDSVMEQIRIDLYLAKNDHVTALKLFKALFKTCKMNETSSVDCHSLSSGAAFTNVALFIEENPGKPFDIITGVGLHSKQQPLKMQEYIFEHLKKFYPKLTITVDQINKGLLHVSY